MDKVKILAIGGAAVVVAILLSKRGGNTVLNRMADNINITAGEMGVYNVPPFPSFSLSKYVDNLDRIILDDYIRSPIVINDKPFEGRTDYDRKRGAFDWMQTTDLACNCSLDRQRTPILIEYAPAPQYSRTEYVYIQLPAIPLPAASIPAPKVKQTWAVARG